MKKKTSKEILFERFEKVDPTFKRRINEYISISTQSDRDWINRIKNRIVDIKEISGGGTIVNWLYKFKDGSEAFVYTPKNSVHTDDNRGSDAYNLVAFNKNTPYHTTSYYELFSDESINEEVSNETNNNIFYDYGNFLMKNADSLETEFENDRTYGQLAVTPSVPKFSWKQYLNQSRSNLNEENNKNFKEVETIKNGEFTLKLTYDDKIKNKKDTPMWGGNIYWKGKHIISKPIGTENSKEEVIQWFKKYINNVEIEKHPRYNNQYIINYGNKSKTIELN